VATQLNATFVPIVRFHGVAIGAIVRSGGRIIAVPAKADDILVTSPLSLQDAEMRIAWLTPALLFAAVAVIASGSASAQDGTRDQPVSNGGSTGFASIQGGPASSERFYLLLFTAQESVKLPRESHTWAAMARVVDGRIVKTRSISWLPTDLEIEPLLLRVESGRNFSFDHTIRWTLSATRQRISLWGPYEAAPELYARFVARKNFLESGAIGYQCLDFLGEAAARRNGVNCVHALTPIGSQGPGEVLQPYGNSSGVYISQTLERRGLAAPYSSNNEWLLPALGLDRVPLERRSGPAAINAARPSAAAVN